jgi:hypothetical protein
VIQKMGLHERHRILAKIRPEVRADLARQATWLRETLPKIKKKRGSAEASLPMATKPASGSTARSTKRGPESAASLA